MEPYPSRTLASASSKDRHADLNSTTESEEKCGICLLEFTKSIRGRIDGCTHHFCFACIMEWAKTESRCPLCRQRFRSIHRPAVPGLFPTERLVKIPERDQVYHPLGVESSAINETQPDPRCTLCHSSANEAYLLCCELCNSAFHTGCVGLGVVIPEVEWYCPDCHICRNYSKTQSEEDDYSRYVDQQTREKIRKIRRGSDSVSMQDLVADVRGEGMVNPVSDIPLANRVLMEQGLQELRENWGRVQSGSLQISDVMRPYRKIEAPGGTAAISGAGREISNRESRDIRKSWEMMEKARLALAKEAPQKNSQQRQPPKKQPRTYGDSVSARLTDHEVSPPNTVFDRFWNNRWAHGGPNGPLGVSNRVPQVGPSFQGRAASSTIEKRECARSEDAKAEIQSLVKHSLSALNDNKKELGTGGYREVARVSTHTILAACGLEHKESLARPFSEPFCNHSKNMTSSLMPSSCRDCFTAFVRQVVKSVLLEKMPQSVIRGA